FIIFYSINCFGIASINSDFPPIFIFTILFKQPYEYIIFSAIIMILGIFKHKENIERLKSKKERKIGEKIKIEK
ncbi:acyl-phosphate glycerol 3-phosphate acyltransferase, partial [bacterium]|nr:acyl-phosphate glycerol 3-phosphate acyltransferase [bacterium]